MIHATATRLEQVPVRVVEVVRLRVHPVELHRAVHLDAGGADTRYTALELVARHLECEVDLAEALPFGMRGVLLEHQRSPVDREALLAVVGAGEEPRPLVAAMVELEADDVIVEVGRLRHVRHDQDDLREAASAHRCASYMPNSSRSALQISPTVQRARKASRMGTSRLASLRATSRTAASAASVSSAFRSARTRAVRSSWRRSAAGSSRCSSIGSSSPSAKRLTPTITRSPASTSRCQRKAASSISSCTKPCSIAATAPPSSSTRSISSHAFASSSSVSASMKYAPPSGSAVSVPPASCASSCCVRSAICTARSLGSASASS